MDIETRWSRGRFRPEFVRRLAYVVFVVVACAQSVSWIQQSLPNYLPKDWSRAHEFDGLEDWIAARFYVEGKNPYAPASLAQIGRSGLGHPPTTGFWFIPLGATEKAIAAEVIDLGNLFLLALLIFMCARELGFPAPAAVATVSFAWWLTTDSVTMNWHSIQLSPQIAFPVVLSWAYLRRGKDVPAGIALGLAATIKLFPGVLMLFLLFARRTRGFLAACAAYLGVAAIMTATYGVGSWTQFLAHQKELAIWMGSLRNASLQGIILRLTSPPCGSGTTPNTRALVMATLGSILLLTIAALISRPLLKHAREQDPRSIDLPFALFSVLAVFVNPWIWEHYTPLLIQPAFVLLARLWERVRETWRDWLDERTPHRTLLAECGAFTVALASVATTAHILRTNQFEKDEMLMLWRAHPLPRYHLYLHLKETLNWLPWVMILMLCMGAVWHLSPKSPTKVAPPRSPTKVAPPG